MTTTPQTQTVPNAGHPVCPHCRSASYRRVLELSPRSLYSCRDCGLASLWPKADDRHHIDYYTKQYFDGSHKLSFDERRIDVYQRDFAVASRGMQPGSLLDFGCGLGYFVVMARRLGWDAVGTELSPQAVEAARNRFGITILQGGLEVLKETDRRFNVITLWNVLDVMTNPVEAAGILHGRLADDGRLAARVFNHDSRVSLYRLGSSVRLEKLREQFSLFHDTVFSAASVTRMLTDQGFTKVVVRNSTLAGDTKGKRLGPAFLRGLDALAAAVNALTARRVFIAPSLLVVAHK